MNYFLEVLKKYAVFSGRARRAEYWYYTLFHFLISAVIGVVWFLLAFSDGYQNPNPMNFAYFILMIFSFATLLPSLGVMVRRLHDTNKSGWYYFISLIPFIGGILLLIALVKEGDNGPNEYGPDPKNALSEGEISNFGQVQVDQNFE